jgi:AsmA protein
MNSIVKWLLIIGGALIVLIIAAALIIPQLIDIKQYKPIIEEKVAQATGRTFTLGEDMDISIFPWVKVKLTDLHLGNPPGFAEKNMVSVRKFEIHLKLLPLLSRQIEVQTFVMDEPIIHLEKLKNGKANWEGMGKDNEKAKASVSEKKPNQNSPDQHSADPASDPVALPIKDLLVNTFSITKGRLIYIDRAAGTKKEISDLNLDLDDISFEKPIRLSLNTKVDKQPVSLKGSLGPLGKNPGQEDIDLDLILKAMKQLEVKIKGRVLAPMATSGFDLDIAVLPFSPVRLAETLKQPIPLKSKDPSVLKKLALSLTAKGDPKNISLTSGKIVLDDSNLDFSAQIKDFHLPNLKFALKLDGIDLDRYLPESDPDQNKDQNKDQNVEKEKTGATGKGSDAKASSAKASTISKGKKTDYGPLRKLILDGTIKIGKLKAKGATLENIDAHILARKGVINISPLKLDLYKGILATTARMDVRKNDPAFRLHMDMKGVQIAPLLKDVLEKEIIEGQANAQMGLSMTGDSPEMIKNTLTGEGELLFADGAVIGVDLADTVRSIKSVFGLSKPLKEKPRTDFGEVKVPFVADRGLVNIDGTTLTSPLIRVNAGGTLHLGKEELDLKVSPKLVGTIKGQGDTKDRSGLTVPVRISGTFDSPKVRPDLKGIVDKVLTTDPKKLKDAVLDVFKGKNSSKNNDKSEPDIGKQIKNIFKTFGQ